MSMEKKIVECVPNFSEGRNMAISNKSPMRLNVSRA